VKADVNVHVYLQYIHAHGYQDATLQTTIYIKEHFYSENSPSIFFITASIRIICGRGRGRRRPLIVRWDSATSKSLSGDIVASPAGLSPRGTCPLTQLATRRHLCKTVPPPSFCRVFHCSNCGLLR